MSAVESRVILHSKGRDFTTEEYFAMSDEMFAAFAQGDMETCNRLGRIMPVHPEAAKMFKDLFGKKYLLSLGADLTEANLRYGEGWLDEPDI